jgi:hypothetical protein
MDRAWFHTPGVKKVSSTFSATNTISNIIMEEPTLVRQTLLKSVAL